MWHREIVIFLARLCLPQAKEEEEVHWVISSDAVAMQSPKGICKILFEIRSAVKTNSQTTIKVVCTSVSNQQIIALLRGAPPAISIYP